MNRVGYLLKVVLLFYVVSCGTADPCILRVLITGIGRNKSLAGMSYSVNQVLTVVKKISLT